MVADGYGQTTATFTAYERDGAGWRQVFGPWTANVGGSGFAPPDAKREGDGRTPSGSYGFDFLFGVLGNPGVKFAYRDVTGPRSCGTTTPRARCYNQWVDTSTQTPGPEPEPMYNTPAYNYGAVIAYNTARTPGLGSAIFLHVSTGGPDRRAACRSRRASCSRCCAGSIPAQQPRIVMGTRGVVTQSTTPAARALDGVGRGGSPSAPWSRCRRRGRRRVGADAGLVRDSSTAGATTPVVVRPPRRTTHHDGAAATDHDRPSAPPPATVAPAPAGPPYAVGVAALHARRTRAVRRRALGNDPGDVRAGRLPVTLRYPGGRRRGWAETDGAAAAAGTFPLVVFAHGYDISAADYDDFTRDLAAQGFVVAAPDFPLLQHVRSAGPGHAGRHRQPGARRVVPRRELLGDGAGAAGHAGGARRARPRPASSATPTAAPRSHGVASNSCCFDGRIGAAVILSGDEGQSGGQWGVAGSPPMLFAAGHADTINPWSLSQRLYDDADRHRSGSSRSTVPTTSRRTRRAPSAARSSRSWPSSCGRDCRIRRGCRRKRRTPPNTATACRWSPSA